MFHLGQFFCQAKGGGDSKSTRWAMSPCGCPSVHRRPQTGVGHLVDHIVVVIAQLQFHRYESWPVLHPGREEVCYCFVPALGKSPSQLGGSLADGCTPRWPPPERLHAPAPCLGTMSLCRTWCQVDHRPTEPSCTLQDPAVAHVHLKGADSLFQLGSFAPRFTDWPSEHLVRLS